MYEPLAKNSITERVPFTGIAGEKQALSAWESVAAEAAHAPIRFPETGPARPDLDRRPNRSILQALR